MLSAIVFLPLAAAIIAGFGARAVGPRGAELITTGALLVALGLSIAAFVRITEGGTVLYVDLGTWIDSGTLEVAWRLRFDTLTAVMLVVVNGVSALVHLYSIGYMAEDDDRPRFFAYLSFFTFAMLMLVTSDNFLQLFLGWEGVGLASYLLIGFWYRKPEANAAALKAFVVNRVGDFGLALGIMAIFFTFDSLDFNTVFQAAPSVAGQTFTFLGQQVDILTTICLLLFIGAMGKSAQLGLHTWLPDAMEGPTPVSALIHAATMVTAGVFLVVRCSWLFEYAPLALDVVTIVGAATALFAATVGLFQNDIKRVIAYSTCSQLGYMFFAAGISAYEAAMFHLFTHAFFKALLFLGAGSVIHAMHHEQDMRRMGGLFRLIPFTWAMMLMGTLALTGVGVPLLGIGTAGFYSKDAIIEGAFAAATGPATFAFLLGLFAAAMTSFYSWRLLFMTFHGPHRADAETLSHVHESPPVMTIPLLVLSLGAILAGILFVESFIGHDRAAFWNNAIFVAEARAGLLDEIHEVPKWVKFSPLVAMLLGLGVAWYFYIRRPELPAQMAARQGLIYTFLYRKWYFDELYDRIFVRPAMALARLLWRGGDGRIIDGLGPDAIAARISDATRFAASLQSGRLYWYAFIMIIGLAALIAYMMLLRNPL